MIAKNPKQFTEFLKAEKIRRFYFVYVKQKVIASHKQLEKIAAFLNDNCHDFMKHEGLFFQLTDKYDILQGAFVHRTKRGQAVGGVRYWSYATLEEYLRDGLRLAKGMTYKNALAGLWWGGGKGVMIHNPECDINDLAFRKYVFFEYGKFLSSLNGCYVTAEDVGTCITDMVNIYTGTRFTTCIPSEMGGSGNPSVPTAKGVIVGIEAALNVCNLGTLAGKTVAVQGMGNVAEPLIGYLFDKGVAWIVAVDINEDKVKHLTNKYREKNFAGRLVEKNDNSILFENVDIIAPCAIGAILNPATIPKITAKIICGAANNQLEDSDRDDQMLYEHGIAYVPDFLTNRMGIVNCANEQYGYINNDPLIENHFSLDWEHSIYNKAIQVLTKSRNKNISPAKVANEIADKLSLEEHPIMGHRGQQIIDSLVHNKWHLL